LNKVLILEKLMVWKFWLWTS